ncbi:MAG: hypothetical protein KAQ87_01850 [Candidatus Pacebacteria bacterium]|nr:hypothetical protein [Candidatus Paceibacterota bacterium]
MNDRKSGRDWSGVGFTPHKEIKKRNKNTVANKGSGKSSSLVKFLLSLVVAVVLIAIVVGVFRLIDFAAIGVAMLIIFIMIVLLLAVIVAGIFSVYTFFAPRDWFWGGKPEEGTACTIVAGTKNKKGSFVKAEISYVGHKLAENWDVVPDEDFQAGKKSFLERIGLGGIFWIGFPSIRRRYKDFFSWTTVLNNGEFEDHNGEFDHVPLTEDTYVILIPKAETTESMVPMDITMLMTAQIINPMKARHKVEHWLQNIAALIKAPAVKLIAQMDNPRDLIGNEELTKVFYNKLEKSGDIKYFRDVYGVKVSRVEVIAIDLDKEAEEAAKKKWKNEQVAAAFIVEEEGKGKGYSKRIGIQTEADVKRIEDINSKVQEFGDLGLTIEYLKAAEKSGKIVLPPPTMIGDAIKQALGGDESSNKLAKLLEEANITKEDIRDFIKAKAKGKEE